MSGAPLALDFDGLLCDALDECVLVSWNAFHGLGIEAFGDRGRAAVPEAFVERFRAVRAVARHLGHFLVPLVSAAPVADEADFDARFARIHPAAVDAFVAAALAYRTRARRERARTWLGLHTLYPGVREVLLELAGRVYVVTAKDAPAVLDILGANGVALDPARVFGDCRSKLEALQVVASSENVDPGGLLFLDDSLANVIEARAAGVDARWATWGYHTPSHITRARLEGVPTVTLDDLSSLLLAGVR